MNLESFVLVSFERFTLIQCTAIIKANDILFKRILRNNKRNTHLRSCTNVLLYDEQ